MSGQRELRSSLARTRPQPRPLAEELTLLRCRVGDYPLAIDVRALLTIDRPSERPAETGLRLIDLRALLGAPVAGPGQSLLLQPDPDEPPLELMVDQGVELVRSDASRLRPWPDPLPGLPGIPALIELEDGLRFLVDPWALSALDRAEGAPGGENAPGSAAAWTRTSPSS